MASPQDPLKPVELRGKPLSEERQSEKAQPPAPQPPARPQPEAPSPGPNKKIHVEIGRTKSQSLVRQSEEGVEINLEQAYAEAKREEGLATGKKSRTATRIAGAPPPSRAVAQERVTEPPPSIPSRADRAPGVSTRGSFRRPCSFPGMLRILLPEQSFEPQVFAVRVMEISSTGARVETRQLTEDLHRIINMEVRFIRLEILIPARERLMISGKLAWIEFQPDSSVMGISFNPSRDDLTTLCMPDWRPPGTDDSGFVSPPVIDSYPPSTAKTPFTFTGHALDADSIIVRGKTEEYRVPVVSGRFEVTIPLVPGTANELIFVALVGEMASDPTPVWIIHRSKGDETAARKAVAGLFKEAVVGENGRKLKVKFQGDGRDLVHALRRLEETASMGSDFEMSFELTGDAEKALGSLKKSGGFPWGSS